MWIKTSLFALLIAVTSCNTVECEMEHHVWKKIYRLKTGSRLTKSRVSRTLFRREQQSAFCFQFSAVSVESKTEIIRRNLFFFPLTLTTEFLCLILTRP